MLTSAELALMKADLATTWPDSIVVQRQTFASDSQGGSTSTWAANGTYSGRVAYVTARVGEEYAAAGRAQAESSWIVTLPGTASVLDTDRLVYSGGTFNVTHVRTPTTWQMTTRVECVELA